MRRILRDSIDAGAFGFTSARAPAHVDWNGTPVPSRWAAPTEVIALATELREPASRRVKVLLVLSAIAEQEGIDASPEEIQAEIDEQLERYGNDPKLAEYLASRRGRSYLRMTLRNRTLVDTLIDRALGTDAAASEPASSASDEAAAEPTQE